MGDECLTLIEKKQLIFWAANLALTADLAQSIYETKAAQSVFVHTCVVFVCVYMFRQFEIKVVHVSKVGRILLLQIIVLLWCMSRA